jgi:putative transposase
MSHAYARNYVHIVFGTEGRRKCIRGEMRERIWAYMIGIAKEYGVTIVAIGGTEDHVHIVAMLPPKIAVAVLLRVLKANSSKWMNEEGHLFSWQRGYGAFSVSASNLEKVCEYVRQQEKHHAKTGFQDEFATFLKKHGIVSGSIV